MNKKIYFMYTGQGSQYFGMCRRYFEQDEVFREWMKRLDEMAVNETGHSVNRYLYENHGENERCDDVTITHLAIMMVEFAMTKSLINKGICPDVLIGSSLGEYVCMAVAEMISLKQLVSILADQTYLLKKKCPPGGMAAVIAEYRPGYPYLQGVEIAAVNYAKHFVISGAREAVDHAAAILNQNGIDVFDIPVCFGFHSSNIEVIQADYAKKIEQLPAFQKSKVPIISSFRAQLVESYCADDLWRIIRDPILFDKAVLKYCTDQDCVLIDVGPSGTLAGFSSHILKRKTGIYGIISPFHTEMRQVERITEELLS